MSIDNKTFKLVQVGCGNMARRWVQYALTRSDIEIVGLVDINQSHKKRWQGSSGSTVCAVMMWSRPYA